MLHLIEFIQCKKILFDHLLYTHPSFSSLPDAVSNIDEEISRDAPISYSIFPAAATIMAMCCGTVFANTAIPEVTPQALIKDIRQGGYVLYLRHTTTEKDFADQITAVMGDCSTQRMLSAKGWQEAKQIGAAFAANSIPVAEVYSSQYCRAWQTAEIAFGRRFEKEALNFEKAEDYTPEQSKAMKDRLTPLLAATPTPGFNTVIVAHDDPFEAATGHYPEPMGVMIVVKPDGVGGFTLVGQIKPGDWLFAP